MMLSLPIATGASPMWEAFLYTSFGLAASWVFSVFRQLFLHDKTEPPAVFHWIPYVGSAVAYGSDPVAFFEKYRAKYGDIFTFTLFGRSVTVYLGPDGNEFILNGKHADINAEEIYGPLTTPVFGKDVVYDCPNAKLMEQKRFVKFGLTQRALEGHVGLVEGEVLRYVNDTEGRGGWIGEAGEVDICAAMAEITLFTAARSLQGREVREKLTAEMAELYHDLDMGFAPVNFLFPGLPLPRNRKRDIAHAKMRAVYLDLIQQRHDRLTARPQSSIAATTRNPLSSIIEDEQKEDDEHEHDMITNLMQSVYKNGTPVSDSEIANMMITLLMGGQHSSSSASSWIMLELAANPDVAEALYQEQLDNLLPSDHLPTTSKTQLPPLTYADLDKLPLLHNVVKETLRLHGSIHSIMRKVKNPLRVPGTPYVVSTDKVLLASPMVTAVSDEFFEDAKRWNPRRWDATAGDSKNKEEPSDQDTIDYGYGAVAKSSTRNPYLPFGAGRHRCIGEKFAYLNLGVIVATIVREFELSTLDGSRGVVPKTDHSSMFARPAAGSMIRWRRRK